MNYTCVLRVRVDTPERYAVLTKQVSLPFVPYKGMDLSWDVDDGQGSMGGQIERVIWEALQERFNVHISHDFDEVDWISLGFAVEYHRSNQRDAAPLR